MINLTPIPKEIQKRMREKMNAVARDTPYYPNASTDELTQEKMLTRTTFMKMVSGQNNPVILMGGELVSGGRVTDSDGNPILSSGRLGDHIAEGYDEVYGPRTFTADYAFDTLGENTAKRPMPGVKSLTATFQGGIKARREATISWVCWSFDDLNRLMPHFLAHGKTVMIQWGWIYDKNSLRSYDTFMSGKKIKRDAYNSNHLIKVIDQKGDYDMMTGVIKNFSFTARQDGGFDCETIITSVGVNILSNTEGTISSIDPITTYEISKGDKKNRFKIREALDSASEEGTDNKLVRLNSTMSLKIFLSNINSYIFQETKKNGTTIEFLERNPLSQKSPKGEESGPLIDKALIKYVPNKYIQATALDGEGRNNNYFVRCGWFEDNILSESLSKYSLKEIQQGAKDGSLVFYGLGDAKTGGKVYFGLKKNTDYEADYGFTHPELTRNETAIVGVMNNEFGYASKGVSVPSSVLKGIENGATVLDAYAVRSKDYPDGFLPSYYAEFGFKKLGTVKFDPKYVREPELGGSEQKYRRLLAQWRTQGWNEKFGFPDLVIMKWQGFDAIRKNATRRFLEEGTQGFRNRITKRTVGTARNLSGQSATGSVGRKQQSGGKGDTRFNQGQVQTGNRTPVSEGFRRNIQSLTGATPEQLRTYGLLT